jgi:uncharacterized protein YlzI (FlbEa/FlbD family)
VIAVTCRNGEHFSVDPISIERVETDPDTVIHLVDGTKYVVAETFDQLLRTIQDHRSTLLLAQHQLAGGVAEIVAKRPAMRVERRRRSRDTDSRNESPAAVLPGPDEG